MEDTYDTEHLARFAEVVVVEVVVEVVGEARKRKRLKGQKEPE